MIDLTPNLKAQLPELAAQAQSLLDADQNAQAQVLVNKGLTTMAAGYDQCPATVRLLTVAATLAHRRGESAETARFATAAVGVATALNDPYMQALAQLSMARASLGVGDNDQTLAALEATWPVARDGTDLPLKFGYQTIFGIVHKDIGHFKEALEWYQQAQATARLDGSVWLQAWSAANLTGPWLDAGDRAWSEGEHEAAREAWLCTLHAADFALPLLERTQVLRWKRTTVINRSAALVRLKRDGEALEALALGQQMALQSHHVTDQVLVSMHTVRLLQQQGHPMAALKEAERGIAIGEAGQALNVLIEMYALASRLAEECADLAAALKYCRRQHALHLEVTADRAAMRSKVLAIRLATEKALDEANTARQRAATLQEANIQLRQEAVTLGQEAMMDSLTGVANRRRLDLFLAKALADARERNVPLCVAMVDVDHFKAINDNYSHAVGDRVLEQLGRLLHSVCRDDDLPARYGGEEFALVITHVGIERAVAVAERLRLSIAEFDWTPVAPKLAVTVSIGVCDISQASDMSQALRFADHLLYRAKAEGRNRVVSAP